MTSIKRIGFVTGTRADYGLLSKTIHLVQQDSRFEGLVFVCGTHFSENYGNTINELRDDGVDNIVPVEMLLSSSSMVGTAKSMGLAVLGFTDAFSYNQLDAIIILGDRYEALAAAQTAMVLGIPIVHIHGGEITEGAFDDGIRHAITKMANIHFVATSTFARRVCQLGENEDAVFVVGAPGLDNINSEQPLSKAAIFSELGLDTKRPVSLVTYHPVTRAMDVNENDIYPLIESIKENSDMNYVITYPNADGGGDEIIRQWQSISKADNIKLVPSLGTRNYLSLMKYATAVIGNSSSGIIEAPSFKISTINIGTRQRGRPRALSVIDVDMNQSAISDAIKLSCNKNYKQKLQTTVNPYGQGDAALQIIELLAQLNFADYQLKSFVDRV